MGEFQQEALTLQTWFKKTAGLNSYREGVATHNSKPVVALEVPSNIGGRNITRYRYTKVKRQYCVLYANDYNEVVDIQEKLTFDLEERVGTLEVKQNGVVVGKLKNCKINFRESDGLRVPFDIEYEVTYGRVKPTPLPNAANVVNKQNIGL